MADNKLDDGGKFIQSLYGKMVIASTIALAGNFLAQIAGTVIAGQTLSDSALTVVGIATPIYYIYGAAGALLGIGCASLCANHIGKSEFLECHQVFTMTYILTFLFSFLLTALIWLFIDPITVLLGATADNIADVKRYCLTMATGGIGVMLIFPAFNILRIDGRNKTAASVFILSGATGIALNFFFLYVMKMGVAGVALATCIGSGVAGIVGGLVIFMRSENFKAARPDRPVKKTVDIIITGTPGAMEYFCFFVCMLVLNNLLTSHFGGSAVAVYKVADSINSFALIFIWGIVGPVTPLAGVFGAERDTKSISDTLGLASKRGLAIIIPLTVSLLVFAPQVANIFGMKSASAAVRIFALSLPLSLINHILIYLYQGGKKVFLANALMVSRMALWIIAVAFPLAMISENAVWWSFLIAEILTLATAFVLSAFARKGDKNIIPLLLIDISSQRSGRYISFSTEQGQAAEAAANIVGFCEQNDLSPKTTMSISLAIEEMLVVIFEKSKPNSVSVRVLIVDKSDIIIMRVRSDGKLFNPIDYALKASLAEELDVMGIKIILKLSVSIDYRNTFGVNNTTIIIKR